MASKIPLSYIESALKTGGYIAEYMSFYSKTSGGEYLVSSSLSGVSLMDEKGKLLYELDVVFLGKIKKELNLKAVGWEHKETNSYGTEYYWGGDDE